MLKPKYLDDLPRNMVELYSQAEMDILADMARRISTYDYFIPAAQWQYRKLIEMGNFHNFIIEALAARTGRTRQEIERLMEDAGMKALAFDDAIYRKAGLTPSPLAQSPPLQAILQTGIQRTNGLFDNLTRSTANTATGQFEAVLDQAYMQITSGAFDRNTAIRNGVKSLAEKGVASVKYPTGHTDYLEVAVRRATLTGVNQTALKLQDARAQEMGCDLVETSAHVGARPDHAIWQGKVFSRTGTKYPDFVASTGYGTGEGLGGWNCRHSFYPFYEGLSEPTYSQQELAKMDAKTVKYNGQRLTEYEASQVQRNIERKIRRWKREYTAMGAAGLPTEEAAAKIARWQNIQKDFLRQTGFKHQGDREQIAGFGRKEAARAAASAKKTASVSAGAKLQNTPLKVNESAEVKQMLSSLPVVNVNDPRSREAFAEKVIDNLGIDRSNIKVAVENIKERGSCSIDPTSSDLKLVYNRYTLQLYDDRSIEYQIKTSFHEAYHLKGAGLPTDLHSLYSKGEIEKWKTIEETFAETSAHYAAKTYGIKKTLYPAYSDYLIKTLPRLKQTSEFASCNSVADFGKIVLEKRLKGGSSEWGKTYDILFGVPLDDDGYFLKYLPHIEQNKTTLLQAFYENAPFLKTYEPQMLKEIDSAISTVKNGGKVSSLSGNEKMLMDSLLIGAMNDLGVL